MGRTRPGGENGGVPDGDGAAPPDPARINPTGPPSTYSFTERHQKDEHLRWWDMEV
jgi:hypothetical protein